MESRANLAHHAGFDAVLTIFGAVHVDVRTHRGNERHRRKLVEDVHVIDVTQCQQHVGALRLRTIATKDRPCHDFPRQAGDTDDPAVVLELDYWVLLPR